MDHARTGWYLNETFFKTLDEYPMQCVDQIYCNDTEEWILLDRSGSSKGNKCNKNDE